MAVAEPPLSDGRSRWAGGVSEILTLHDEELVRG
jgi:hypothetical protein